MLTLVQVQLALSENHFDFVVRDVFERVIIMSFLSRLRTPSNTPFPAVIHGSAFPGLSGCSRLNLSMSCLLLSFIDGLSADLRKVFNY